jgi:hypothetical protein
MNKKQYEEWIEHKLKSFSQFLPDKMNPAATLGYTMQNNKRTYHTLYAGNFFVYADLIAGETVIFDTKTMRSAKAKCHYEDTFSIYEGIAVAWAKYNNEVVPQYEKSIHRDELQNGDMFISSVNKSNVVTFIGWIPNCRNGMVGKWAIVLDEKKKPLKTQIAEEVVKTN